MLIPDDNTVKEMEENQMQSKEETQKYL